MSNELSVRKSTSIVMEPHEQHYYATTAFGFAVAADPMTAMQKVLKQAKGIFKRGSSGPTPKIFVTVFHVPLPLESRYEINYYTPQVNGITKIFEDEV